MSGMGVKMMIRQYKGIYQHLFISFPFARLVWWIVHVTFNLPPPLVERDKQKQRLKLEWGFALCVRLYGMKLSKLYCFEHIWLLVSSMLSTRYSMD
jgi:hypothetical protein